MTTPRKVASKPQNLLERRTLVVWVSLVAAMTVATGLLLVLQPMPLARSGGLALMGVGPSAADTLDVIFRTDPAPTDQRWQSIIVHHSGQGTGDAQSLGDLHQRLGYGDLSFHFVIANGEGAEDGLIQVGPRWVRQVDGVYAPGAISICLVGNGDQALLTRAQMGKLVQLVTELQVRLGIPAEQVYLHRQLTGTTSPGRLFPEARFRQGLVDLPAVR